MKFLSIKIILLSCLISMTFTKPKCEENQNSPTEKQSHEPTYAKRKSEAPKWDWIRREVEEDDRLSRLNKDSPSYARKSYNDEYRIDTEENRIQKLKQKYLEEIGDYSPRPNSSRKSRTKSADSNKSKKKSKSKSKSKNK